MSEQQPASPRKNARDTYRAITDAEAFGQDLDAVIRLLRTVLHRLIPEHEHECAALLADQPELGVSDAVMNETQILLGTVKGRMYLERVSHGLTVADVAPGSGWSVNTLRQFELRETDALFSSLVRYAHGLRAAGVRGRIEVRWVPDPPQAAEGVQRLADAA